VLLTAIWLAAAAGAVLAALPRVGRGLGLAGASASFALAAAAWWGRAPAERAAWVAGPVPVSYHLSMDGPTAVLVTLTAAIALAAAASAGGGGRLAWILALGAAAEGVFLARDLILFYVFWEAMLVPAYFLLAGWGATPGRRRAAFRFVLYNVGGSLAMLAAVVAAGLVAGSFDLPAVGGALSPGTQAWVLLGMGLGFAVKTPLWPLHGWVADAYAEAPPEAAALMAGIQSKAGLYGFWRFGPALFPDAAAHAWPLLAGLALVSVLYGGLAALGQREARRILAYSSVSHLGLAALGLAAQGTWGVAGAFVAMVSHGLFSAMLFLLVGRLGPAARLGDVRGLYRAAPALGAALTFAAMAALGLPGLAGFPGELLVLAAVFARSPYLAGAASLGAVLAAAYMIRLVQSLVGGSPGEAPARVRDLRAAERIVLAPLAGALLLFGLWPQPLVRAVVSRPEPAAVLAPAVPDGAARAGTAAGVGRP
jgi:NADH-quinone oxidoreductase subunit M